MHEGVHASHEPASRCVETREESYSRTTLDDRCLADTPSTNQERTCHEDHETRR